MYSTGAKQHLYVSDPKLLRELKLHNSLNLCRPTYLSKPLKPLLGNGLIVANGHEWVYQRKLIAPEFYLDKVKVFTEYATSDRLPESIIVIFQIKF